MKAERSHRLDHTPRLRFTPWRQVDYPRSSMCRSGFSETGGPSPLPLRPSTSNPPKASDHHRLVSVRTTEDSWTASHFPGGGAASIADGDADAALTFNPAALCSLVSRHFHHSIDRLGSHSKFLVWRLGERNITSILSATRVPFLGLAHTLTIPEFSCESVVIDLSKCRSRHSIEDR